MPKPPRRWLRILSWGAPALVVLAIIGLFVARAAIASYLRSEGFREFLARRIGTSLHAQAAVAPLSFTGMNLYAEGLRAQGFERAAFSDLQIDGVRAELSLRRFSERVWQVDSVTAQRLQLTLGGPRSTAPDVLSPVAAAAPPSRGGTGGWLPNRVEIAQATVRDTDLRWAGGGVTAMGVQMEPQEGGWKITGAGGKLAHAGLPPLDIQSVRLLHRRPELFVQSAELRQPGGGSVKVTGTVNTAEALDLRAELDGLTLSPFLDGDWRVRFRGQASGEVTVRTPLPTRGPVDIHGSLRIANGELEALPVLDEIAAFTRTQSFRRLKLTRASADFQQTGPRLAVSNFIAEAERLIRIEGGFALEQGMIDGTFQVGVTAASLQWLPGSQARIFTVARDGYLWTPMRLTGPVDKPVDDLTPRLAEAAAGAVIEKAQELIKAPVEAGKGLLKDALDLLLPKAK